MALIIFIKRWIKITKLVFQRQGVVRGTYNFRPWELSIQGYRLENSCGKIGIGSYQAILNINGKNFESGRWSGGGLWEAIKQDRYKPEKDDRLLSPFVWFNTRII